jgi:putative ABC transport system permease protein
MQAWAMPRAVDLLESRDTAAFDVVARLGSGVSLPQAEAALQSISAALDRQHPRLGRGAPEPRRARVVRASRVPTSLRAPVAAFTGMLAAVVLLVLALTALNLANLLLARGATRSQEMSLRHALGAGRGSLVRQLLTEQLLLAGVGGLAGLGLTVLMQRVLSAMPAPTPVPLSLDLRLDARVFGAAIAAALLTWLLVGLLPAWRASHVPAAGALRRAAEGDRLRLRRVLLGVQIAGSLALLTLSGLRPRASGGPRPSTRGSTPAASPSRP